MSNCLKMQRHLVFFTFVPDLYLVKCQINSVVVMEKVENKFLVLLAKPLLCNHTANCRCHAILFPSCCFMLLFSKSCARSIGIE
jgi:hypothetical protein